MKYEACELLFVNGIELTMPADVTPGSARTAASARS